MLSLRCKQKQTVSKEEKIRGKNSDDMALVIMGVMIIIPFLLAMPFIGIVMCVFGKTSDQVTQGIWFVIFGVIFYMFYLAAAL